MLNFNSDPQFSKKTEKQALQNIERILAISEKMGNLKVVNITINQVIGDMPPISGLTTIPNNADAGLLQLNVLCNKCGIKWTTMAVELKINKLNQLLLYCPECYDPPAEVTVLPTLSTFTQIWTQRAKEQKFR